MSSSVFPSSPDARIHDSLAASSGNRTEVASIGTTRPRAKRG
jgi:hypothetical protein